MGEAVSKAEADRQAQAAQQMVAMVSLFFTGRQPGVIGCTLAELMAIFLGNHKIPNDPERERDLRTKLMARWCETVWQLVAEHEGKGAVKQ